MSSRALRWTAGIVVALVVLLVAADRIGAAVAERVAADTLESSQHLRSRPDVHIAGFPFLTQWASGHYGEVTVTAHDVPIGRSAPPLTVSRVRVVLHQLTVSGNFSRFHARTAVATASVSYADLSRTLGIGVSYAGAGRIRAAKTLSLPGAAGGATLTARPMLQGGALTFTDTRIDAPGRPGGAAPYALARHFRYEIPLRRIPFDVRARRLEVDEGGIAVVLIGHDLEYTR